jgi:hypothetical protein
MVKVFFERKTGEAPLGGSPVIAGQLSLKALDQEQSIAAVPVWDALAQQYFCGPQLVPGEAILTRGALVKPIDNLTGADFFPDIIGMEQHIVFGHLFSPILLYPFLHAQRPGHEHVGQTLRFCLCDLVKIKAVPARTCTTNLLKLLQSCLLASIHRLGIRSSLSSRSAKSVASNALI